MSLRKYGVLCFAALVASILTVGCGSAQTVLNKEKGNGGLEGSDNSPVTLTLASPYPWFGFDDTLTQLILKKVHEKFPNVTLKLLDEKKGSSLDQLVAKNTPPDILYAMDSQILWWEQLGVAADLTPYIQKYKVDLNRYNPAWTAYLRNKSTPGTFDALPFLTYYDIIYYNKDIFDRFGVAYPKNGMTWPQFEDLVKKVTRVEDGIQYKGFTTNGPQVAPSQFPLLYLDPNTDKANVTTPKWAEVMQFYKDIYSIPGNTPAKATDFYNGKLAMFQIGAGGLPDAHFDYGMVSLPTWPDAPDQTQAIGGRVFGLGAAGKHKDLAFKVIQYLTSNEIEEILIRNGQIPSIQSPTLLQEYGKDSTVLKGKDVSAVIYGLTHYKSAVLPKTSQYESYGPSIMNKYIGEVASNKLDINTALQKASDEINKKVQTAKQQQKK